MNRTARLLALSTTALALALTSACATTKTDTPSTDTSKAAATGTATAPELRLGYFANVTHASAVYGVGSGIYADELGSTALKTQIFNAGPAAVEALFGGALDATYIGPNPAINAFVKSKGEAIRIVAGATSGGASLVVRPDITSAAQLKGKKIASPQTGGTQDVALRTYLAKNGLKTDIRGAGDTTIIAEENSQTLQLFKDRKIDGGWVPEPWASRLVLEGGGKVLVDEKSLWPEGKFVTTHLIVRTEFLNKYPGTVKALIKAQIEADKEIAADPAKAKTVVNEQLKKLTGKALKPETIDRAFANITVTEDPIASSLKQSAANAVAAGLVKQSDLKGIYDLRFLEELLGRTVDDAGLGS
ncbi:MAG: sulfonate transport system substrate-binding protein [Actinomycetota bacterium]|jgi:NitT/TauT family transport system substrate-binding protein|nr:sulfonate transport system substrate-binding protein [Actinomycetota bacterium]